MAHHYEGEDEKCQYETIDKVLMVIPNMQKYQLTPDALARFKRFHDYIELDILKRYHVQEYISGILSNQKFEKTLNS